MFDTGIIGKCGTHLFHISIQLIFGYIQLGRIYVSTFKINKVTSQSQKRIYIPQRSFCTGYPNLCKSLLFEQFFQRRLYQSQRSTYVMGCIDKKLRFFI